MNGSGGRRSVQAALTALALVSSVFVLVLSGCEAPPRSEAEQAYDQCMAQCQLQSGEARGLEAQAYCVPQCEHLSRKQ